MTDTTTAVCHITDDPETTMFCEAMKRRHQFSEFNPEAGPGWHILILDNLTTDQRVMRRVCVKTSKRDHGIMLNYCPFCGERMLVDGFPAHGARETAKQRAITADIVEVGARYGD